MTTNNLLDSLKATADADALNPRGIPMTDGQWDHIGAIADATGRSRAYVVRTAVDRFLAEVGEIPNAPANGAPASKAKGSTKK
jgi:hypothetical protein